MGTDTGSCQPIGTREHRLKAISCFHSDPAVAGEAATQRTKSARPDFQSRINSGIHEEKKRKTLVLGPIGLKDHSRESQNPTGKHVTHFLSTFWTRWKTITAVKHFQIFSFCRLVMHHAIER